MPGLVTLLLSTMPGLVTLLVLSSLCTGGIVTQESVPDGVRGSGTSFVKCGGGFFGGSKRCFEVSVSRLVVQIGEDGTNDDVTVKVGVRIHLHSSNSSSLSLDLL